MSQALADRSVRRRALLAAGLAGLGSSLAGCSDLLSRGPPPREFPERPDPLDESSALAYAREYREVRGYERIRTEGDDLAEINYRCDAAFATAAGDGYVVVTMCGWSTRTHSDLVGDGPDVMDAILVTESAETVAELEVEPPTEGDGVPERPGLQVVNFADAAASLEVRVVPGGAEGPTEEEPVLDRTFDLDPRAGHLLHGLATEAAVHDVAVTTEDGRRASAVWETPPDEEPTTDVRRHDVWGLGFGATLLPDASLSLDELSPGRSLD